MIRPDQREPTVTIPREWLRDLWAMKSQWLGCPECDANAYKPEDVRHMSGCAFAAALGYDKAAHNGK